MGRSIYQKTERIERNVGSDQSNGGGQLRIALNRDHLTAEHQVIVEMTQVCTVAPTANTSFMPMIEYIAIETDKGQMIVGDGESIAELSAFTENAPSERVCLGLYTTAKVVIDLHHEFDAASRDLIGAIETGELSQCDLVIRLATDVSGLLTGETIGAGVVPSYTVKVNAITYPDLTGIGVHESLSDSLGNEVPNEYAGVGTASHRVGVQSIKGTQKGALQPIRLQSAGSMARFVQMMAVDTATGLRSDGVISNIRLVANGQEKRGVHFHDVQASNEAMRNVLRIGSGLATLDFGDDEEGYLDLSEVNEAWLFIEIDANAPAAWEIHVCEDYLAQ